MNKWQGIVKNNYRAGDLTLLDVKVYDQMIKTIVVDNPQASPYLKIGSKVNLLFKATEVILGLQNDAQFSVENRLLCQVTHIKKGQILDQITLSYKQSVFQSIISSNATVSMKLAVGKEVIAYIKINEIIIAAG